MFFRILSSAELLGCTTMDHTCCQETDRCHWMMNASLWGDTCLQLCWFVLLGIFFLTEPVSRAVLFCCSSQALKSQSLWEKVKQACYFYYCVSISLTAVMQMSQDTRWACQRGITPNKWVTVCPPHHTVRRNIRPGAFLFHLYFTANMSKVGQSELNPGDLRLRLPSSSPSSSFSGSMSSAWVIQSR